MESLVFVVLHGTDREFIVSVFVLTKQRNVLRASLSLVFFIHTNNISSFRLFSPSIIPYRKIYKRYRGF